VTDAYKALFTFTGNLEEVAFDVSGELIHDHEATMRTIMAHQ
jgi:arylsulfatase